MKYYCNPVNITYPYQFKKEARDNYRLTVNREAADPSMVMYKGMYYLFASMTGSVWVSEDMAEWKSFPLPANMPIYDYAPDVRVLGDWLYFTASNRGVPCSFYRTKDPIHGPYEEIKGVMDYWDPNLFLDEDGKLYFYWGCANATPLWGIELDPETMHPIGEKKELIFGNPWENGYERFGENNSENPRTEEEIEALFQEFLASCGDQADSIPEDHKQMIRATYAGMPYIEGAWMTKKDGIYYLQYACPGAELNVYADGVYVGTHPLGPFKLAKNNPFSCKPGGFIPGAGHGSTMEDRNGDFWHTATMRISKNHVFERRVGIWPAGFDADGELFCNQSYGDWPICVEQVKKNPFCEPNWYLLSYQAKVESSGCVAGHSEKNVVDENVQTWWKAENERGAWLTMDLGEEKQVHAIQINFADDCENVIACPGEFVKTPDTKRYIDLHSYVTRWTLEGSADGKIWTVLKEKKQAATDLSHDFIVMEEGKKLRFLRLTIHEVPYGVKPSISGLRVFGIGNGAKPAKANCQMKRISPLDFLVTVEKQRNTDGVNILWGHEKDKLYHSYMVMGECKEHRVGGLVANQSYYVRVDTFNENGITHGTVMELL